MISLFPVMLCRYARRSSHSKRTTSVALVCTLAHLFALAHLVVVPHERCPEHGEVVHHDSADSAPAAITPAAPSTRSALPDRPDQLDGDHEHCLSVTERRAYNDGDTAAPARVALDRIPRALALATSIPGRAVYRSAPKTSPPADS